MIYCIAHDRDTRNEVLKGIIRRCGPIYYCSEGNPARTWVKVDDDVKIEDINDLDHVQDVIESALNQDTCKDRKWFHVGGLL